MTRTIVDINILHSVPPSNINRDDTGSPKTAVYGGVRRARVSSQAWKRATRLAFSERLDASELGHRSKRVVEILAERIRQQDDSIAEDTALSLAGDVLKAAGVKLSTPKVKKGEEAKPDESGFLLFLSSRQYDQLAGIGVAAQRSDDPAATIKAAEPKKKLNLDHSVDISLFGRMVADSTDLNVDAAAQVAHAISVHAVENEFDYFTAVDDRKNVSEEEDSGAAMIGTVEFNSSTLYRYATVDANRLNDNLGNPAATAKAVEAFVEAFVTSMPTGKQNSFANRTLPEAVVVSIRDTQSVNLVGAFEEAITENRLATASSRLAEYAAEIDSNYGTTPVQSWVVLTGSPTQPLTALGEKVSLTELATQVGAAVAERITA